MQLTGIRNWKFRICPFVQVQVQLRTLCMGDFTMVIHLRGIVFAALALVCFIPPPVSTAQGHEATISAVPGTLVRWASPGATRCSMRGRSWAALEGSCYYPIDLLDKPGPIAI